MFTKHKIAAAVLAATAATSAHAVHLSDDGTGQVLIFPYYNVNNGFASQFSITNTTSDYKVVKVRFRESRNSNDVLDFNVYMSPYDQWTSVVTKNAGTGVARLTTSDNTCVYPSVAQVQSGVDFMDLYDDVSTDDTLEGYVEVIEMGNVDPAAYVDPTDMTSDGPGKIVTGLKHGSDGKPKDCSVVTSAWDKDGSDDTKKGFLPADHGSDPNRGMLAPTGGLTGYSILLNANNGAAYVADPAIIADYSDTAQHYRSDDEANYLLPSLASGDVSYSRVPAADGTVTPVTWHAFGNDPGEEDPVSIDGKTYKISSGKNPMPMAHVLAATGISNDFFVQTEVDGATDWVVTFPMKKHAIWNSKAYTENNCKVGENTVTAMCPYTSVVGGATTDNTVVSLDDLKSAGFTGSDVEFTFVYYDREEQVYTAAAGNPGFSPVLQTEPTAHRMTREVNVLSFREAGGSTTSVLGTPSENVFSVNLESGWDQGWMKATFDSMYKLANAGVAPEPLQEITSDATGLITTGGETISGVPAIGFAAIRASIGPAAMGESIPHTRYKD